jgi:DNA-binding NtrC family response regulator
MNLSDYTFPDNLDLKERIRFDDENGYIWLDTQRMILMHASAFGVLRAELVEAFGMDYAKGVLIRMGYSSGESDAQLARKLRPDAEFQDVFMVGPQLHNLEGVVDVKPLVLEMDADKGHFYGEFIWTNSFEAKEHLQLFGNSDKSVCWNLLGYASGYTSALFKKPIYYKEVECIGKGDSQCRIIGKPLEDWDAAENIETSFALSSLHNKLENLEATVEELTLEARPFLGSDKIVADSVNIQQALFLLGKAAETDVTVMILGETGVGKEVFANYLHKNKRANSGDFVPVNCAALPKDLIEAELFGVEKGAYTGADKARAGRFERADGGTIFLDELGELSEPAQAKLLRVLQFGEIERVGGTKVIKVNVRLIAATNDDLMQKVKAGSFRADLYYRLNVFPITVPPLRERLSDLQGLINKFLTRLNRRYGREVLGVTDKTLEQFYHYSWPGNVRELENIMERGVILTADGSQIEPDIVCAGMPAYGDTERSLNTQGDLAPESTQRFATNDILSGMLANQLTLDDLELGLLESALKQANNNLTKAASLLGITAAQFRYRIKKSGDT